MVCTFILFMFFSGPQYHEVLVGKRGLLQRFVHTGHEDEVKRAALQCMENIAIRSVVREAPFLFCWGKFL